MTATLERSIVASTTQVEQAQNLESSLSRRPAVRVKVSGEEMPDELLELIRDVIGAVAHGKTVTVRTAPEVMTTTEAAQELGISRPTLMKMVRNAEIPSHKVGTHTRLKSSDVFDARGRRVAEQRRALAELMDLSDEIGDV